MDIPATQARHFRLLVRQKTKIPEFVLHGVVKVNHAEDKAGFAAPYDFADYLTPETADAVHRRSRTSPWSTRAED